MSGLSSTRAAAFHSTAEWRLNPRSTPERGERNEIERRKSNKKEFTHCVKIWEEPDSRSTVHWERHKRFDVQRRLHHEGGCAHESREGSGVACAACREQNKTESVSRSHPLPSQAPSTQLLSCDLQSRRGEHRANTAKRAFSWTGHRQTTALCISQGFPRVR